MKSMLIRCLCAVTVAISLAGFMPVPALAASPPDFEIVFSPDNLRLEKGESFSIDVIINNNVNTRIIGAQVYINFNPSVLRCDSITQKGKIFTDWVTSHGGTIDDNIIMYPSGSINNTTGSIGLGVSIIEMYCDEWWDRGAGYALVHLGDGPTEGGILCTLNFTALSTDGISTMTFDDTTTNLHDYKGQTIISGVEIGSGKVIVGQPDGPDLSIENPHGEWIVQEDGTYNIVFTIKNIGTRLAGPSTATVSVTNTEYEADIDIDEDNDKDITTLIVETVEVECGALDAGETETLTAGPFTIIGDKDDVEIILDVNEYVTEVDEYNNIQKILWLKFTLSDLTVESASCIWEVQNQRYKLTFSVKNIYYGNSEPGAVAVYSDGNQIAVVKIPSLKPQQIYTSSQIGPFNFFGYNDIIEVTADPENVIEEKDETNNTFRYAVTRSFPSGDHDKIIFLNKTDTCSDVAWKDVPVAVEFWVTLSEGSPEPIIYEDHVKYTEMSIPVNTLHYDTQYKVRVWAKVPYLTTFVYRLVYTTTFATLPIPPSYTPHLSPSNGACGIPVQVSFAWDTVSGATSYDFEICIFPVFSKAAGVIQKKLLNTYVGLDTPLEYGTTYYWRVRAVGSGGPGDWVESSFTTVDEPAIPTVSAPQTPVYTFVSAENPQQSQGKTMTTITIEYPEEETPVPVFVRAPQQISRWLYVTGGIAGLSLLLGSLLIIAIRRQG
jgi:hypothetical protein